MTTHVSRERREQVAKAILNTQQTWGRADQVWEAARPDHHANALKYADAAIAALLPDAEQFMDLLDDLMCLATEYGSAAPSSERERWAAREVSEARDALIALVYGEKEERE